VTERPLDRDHIAPGGNQPDRKRPVTVTGRPASSTDPETWTTFLEAKASTAGTGFGFVLNGDGIAGLDLDHCVTDGVLSPAALAILERLPGTYAELSPSGHGVRLFCRADVARGPRITVDGCALEVYGNGRFLTVTGNRLPGRPSVLADLDAAVHALVPA
jgi:primase-polymerase (primpol)-like protein